MLQLGFGWHITTDKWDSILEEIKNKYGTSTIK